MRGFIAATIALVVALPFAIAGTFLLLPLWTWIEGRCGIEAVGHASLPEWCFAATWAVLGLPLAVVAWRAIARRGAPPARSSPA
jgi:hypothetical protein